MHKDLSDISRPKRFKIYNVALVKYLYFFRIYYYHVFYV